MIWVLQPEKENSPSPKPAICLPPPTPPAVSDLLLWPSVRHFPSCNGHARCPVYFYIEFSCRSPYVFLSSRCVRVFLKCHQTQRALFCSHAQIHTHGRARTHTLGIPIWWAQAREKKGYTFAHSQIFPPKNTARYLSARTDCCSLQVCETGGDTEVVSTSCLSMGFIVFAHTDRCYAWEEQTTEVNSDDFQLSHFQIRRPFRLGSILSWELPWEL